jgi:hypothetical protein
MRPVSGAGAISAEEFVAHAAIFLSGKRIALALRGHANPCNLHPGRLIQGRIRNEKAASDRRYDARFARCHPAGFRLRSSQLP